MHIAGAAGGKRRSSRLRLLRLGDILWAATLVCRLARHTTHSGTVTICSTMDNVPVRSRQRYNSRSVRTGPGFGRCTAVHVTCTVLQDGAPVQHIL